MDYQKIQTKSRRKKGRVEDELLYQIEMSESPVTEITQEENSKLDSLSEESITSFPEEHLLFLLKVWTNPYARKLLAICFKKIIETEADEQRKNIFIAKAFRYKPINNPFINWEKSNVG